MKRTLLFALAGLLISSSAFAQPKTQPNILQIIHDDAVAASADAKSNNDVIAQTCYDAIAVTAQAKLDASAVTGGGALLIFQKTRDFTRLNSSPVGTALIVGCAPLVQDAKVNFVQFFANIGGAVLLKGIIPIP